MMGIVVAGLSQRQWFSQGMVELRDPKVAGFPRIDDRLPGHLRFKNSCPLPNLYQNDLHVVSRRCSAGTSISLDLASIADASAPPSTQKLPSPERSYGDIYSSDVMDSLRREGEAASCDDEKIQGLIDWIRAKFHQLSDGEILASAYDTAWVARVPATVNGSSDGPLFPRALQWVLDNQLDDGSWGDEIKYSAYDRLLNTLACVVSLKTWNTGHSCIQKGLEFLRKNLEKLQDEAAAQMLSGFEFVFISLVDEAKLLGLQLPYDFPFIDMVREARDEKLKRIPLEKLHSRATTLLYSLEGLQSVVDWGTILKLQSRNGSFLTSPASTACVLIHTGDQKCLEFLTSTLSHYDHMAVPCNHPVDLFERLWVVDSLQRLGIDHLFRREIKDALDYVYRYWTPIGIGWARENPVQDIDDTSMAFRLLRLNGYEVSADVFEHFKNNGKFFCFPGERQHGVSEMLNLYRASQVRFPHETILEEANKYARSYLINAISSGEIFDKWSLKKDLAGEIVHVLNYSSHWTLPRLEHRTYIQQYGTEDAWLAKNIYRLPFVSNKTFLDLAKLDFNRSEKIFQGEVQALTRWWEDTGIHEIKFVRQRPVQIYSIIAGGIFEPEFSALRLAMAKLGQLITAFDDYMDTPGLLEEHCFLFEAIKRWDPILVRNLSKEAMILFNAIYNTTNDLSKQASKLHGHDVSGYIIKSWEMLVRSYMEEAEWISSNKSPSFEEYMNCGLIASGFPTTLLIAMFFGGEPLSDDVLTNLAQQSLVKKGSMACRLINDLRTYKVGEEKNLANLKVEKKWGQTTSSVTCYMKENEVVSEEEAKKNIYLINEKLLLELNWEMMGNHNLIPPIVKRLWFSLVTGGNLFYKEKDEFTFSNEVIKQHVENILFNPVP